MKKILSVLSLSVFFVISSFAQRNYAQELVDLLQQGKCFDAMDLCITHADQLPANDRVLEKLYKSHMSLFLNKPDSAAIYLEDLLTNHELIMGPMIGAYYVRLLQVYDDTQRFKDGIKLCDKFLGYLKRNPFDLNQNIISSDINWTDSVKSALKNRDLNEPRIKIVRTNNKKNAIKLNEGEYIRFNAQYNNIPFQTFFDTGVSEYFFVTKKIADKIGVRIIDTKQNGVIKFNGVETKALKGVIDKINIGNLELFNIPVMVFDAPFYSHLPDTLNDLVRSKIEDTLSENQVIMGLPTMLLIGKVEFDWNKRTISFPGYTGDEKTNNLPNIYLVWRTPYTRLKINGLSYTGYLDSGDNEFLSIEFPFYERNRSSIQIDSVIQKTPLSYHGMTGSAFNLPYEVVKDPWIYSNGKQINPDERVIIVNRMRHFDSFDGTVGVHFFYRLGTKVILDFNNMRIEGKD
ncbi:retropepsin-like aspartic protease [Bacteroides caecimuris]|uniref:retropepsin-like aspartic protease n=1 Tax=Bacteroides caecimuris TaxID=1796613 RepID=UPI00242B77AE|nr:retropepsin-like aspartic protease [Bacteroides caecimuris]